MPDPFLTYLTVFKSRLGLANVIIGLTEFNHQPTQALERKLKQQLERKEEIDPNDPASADVIDYLLSKKLLSAKKRSTGRYRGYALRTSDGRRIIEDRGGTQLRSLPVFEVDRWMSHPLLPSTIGVPIPE